MLVLFWQNSKSSNLFSSGLILVVLCFKVSQHLPFDRYMWKACKNVCWKLLETEESVLPRCIFSSVDQFTVKHFRRSTVFLLSCRLFPTHKAEAICQEEPSGAEKIPPSSVSARKALCLLPEEGGHPSRGAGPGQAGSGGYLRWAAQLPTCQAARHAPAWHVPQRQPVRWPAGNSWGHVMGHYSEGWLGRDISGFPVGSAGSAQHSSLMRRLLVSPFPSWSHVLVSATLFEQAWPGCSGLVCKALAFCCFISSDYLSPFPLSLLLAVLFLQFLW